MRRAAAAILALTFAAAAAMALDVPPKPTAWVTDNGGILSADQEQTLNTKLETLKQRTATEFLVMTFPSLEGEDVTGYTNRVAEQWKVKDDKALMLFVFVQDRKTWIQVGYGLEAVITDAYASRVYRNDLVPHFRNGDYYGGIDEAINDLATKIDPNALQGMPATARPVPVASQSKGLDPQLVIFLVFMFFVFILPMLLRGRRRRSGCGGCFWPLFFMGGGGGGTTFGGGGGGSNWNIGGSWGGGGGSSFGGGGAGGGW